MTRDHHLPGGHRPIHTIQALPLALTVLARSLDEIAGLLEEHERGASLRPLREARARLEQYAGSTRSIAGKIEDALLRMGEGPSRPPRWTRGN